ncbi:MAG: tetratricopeptide repeat protein [Polyangiaceae bacterium]
MARIRSIRLAVGLAAAAYMSGAPARAQSPSDQLLAQSLFDQARELIAQGHYAEACPKLAESQRLDPGGGTLLNLAICHEKENKLATAYTELNAALSQALKDGRKDREDIAREHIAAIAPQVPKVRVHVTREVDGIEVTLDGSSIRKPAWDVPAGVDPGRHVVEASAPGHAPFRSEIVIAVGEQKTVTVPALTPAGAPPPLPPSSVPARDAAPPSETSETRTNPVYWGALGLGTAGMVVGTIGGIVWFEGLLRRTTGCDTARQFCSESSLAGAERERAGAWVSTVAFGVGLVAMGSLIFIPRVKRVGVSPTRDGAVVSVTLPSVF